MLIRHGNVGWQFSFNIFTGGSVDLVAFGVLKFLNFFNNILNIYSTEIES